MQFLNDFQLLKIEDILPFFPDFVTIDHFKVSFRRRLRYRAKVSGFTNVSVFGWNKYTDFSGVYTTCV